MTDSIKNFTDWLLYTSIFAALCAVALCVGTERLILGHPPAAITPLHTFIFGCTLVVYNAHFLLKRTELSISDRYRWTVRHRNWHYFTFVTGLLLSGASVLFLNWKILVACLVLGALSFTYTLPLLPFSRARLRDFGWLKILTLTLVWTIVTGILPMLYYHQSLLDYPFEILLRFVFMFILCIAFDLRDMQTDLKEEINTLPNILGVKNSYRLINTAIIIFIALSVIQYFRYPSAGRLAGTCLVAVLTKASIEYARNHPTDKNYLGLVDGMMLLYGCVVAFLSYYH
jgi:4-hydroxybenzoate polyprenyltransferase